MIETCNGNNMRKEKHRQRVQNVNSPFLSPHKSRKQIRLPRTTSSCDLTVTRTRTALFWVNTQRVVVICFIFRNNLSVPSSGFKVQKSNSWNMKIGPIGCPETSVRN